MRRLAPKYIDTGKVKVEYHHLAQIGPESERAAQAAECANDQNKFWPYVEYAFDHQGGENVGAFADPILKQFALAVGLDVPTFNACFDGNKYAQFVKDETAAGRAKGVRATPSFFVNTQFVEGLPNDTQFASYIDAMTPK